MKKLSQKCVAKVGDVARHATSSSSRLIRPSPQREQALVEIRGLSAETTKELVDCFSHRDPKDSKAVKKDFEAYLSKDQNDDVSREVFAKKMIKIYCDESDGRGAGLKLNETAKVASEWSRAANHVGSRHIKFYHLAQAFPTESGWWPSPPSDPIYSDSAYISSNTHTIDPAFARALDPKSSEQVEWTALAETLKSLLDRFKFAYINQEDFTDSLIHKKYASLKDRTHISLEGAAVRTECPPNLKYKAQGLGIEVKEMLHLIDAFGGPYENLIQDFELALNKHNINNLENRAFAKALSSEVQDFRNVKTGRHRGRVQLSEVAALVTDPQQKDRQHYYKKYLNRSPSHGTVPETMGSASTWEHPQIEQAMSFLSERTKNILNAHPPRKARDYVNTALDSRVKPELVGAFLEGLLACSHLDPNKDLLILIEKNAHNFRR